MRKNVDQAQSGHAATIAVVSTVGAKRTFLCGAAAHAPVLPPDVNRSFPKAGGEDERNVSRGKPQVPR